MRTMLQVSAVAPQLAPKMPVSDTIGCPRLNHPRTQRIVSRLVARRIWEQHAVLWEGFGKYCARNAGAMAPVVLQLPPRQIQDLAERHPTLLEPLRQAARKNRQTVRAGIARWRARACVLTELSLFAQRWPVLEALGIDREAAGRGDADRRDRR
jgi:hypothetical protein